MRRKKHKITISEKTKNDMKESGKLDEEGEGETTESAAPTIKEETLMNCDVDASTVDLNDSTMMMILDQDGMNGVDDNNVSLESDQDLNTTLTDTLQLRKNLFGDGNTTFWVVQQPQHQQLLQSASMLSSSTTATTIDSCYNTSNRNSRDRSMSTALNGRVSMTNHPVAAKIAHFEERSAKANALGVVSSTLATIPSSTCLADDDASTVVDANNRATSQPLSVFLRIRPMSSNSHIISTIQQSCEQDDTISSSSTIEILTSSTAAEITTTANQVSVLPTIIRTHAPNTSNAFKVFRDGGTGSSTTITTGTVDVVKEYQFTGVMGPNTNQMDMYQNTVQPMLHGMVHQGQSGLVFCYGITNAGKTYTITGPETALNVGGMKQHNDNDKINNSNTTSYPRSSWGLVPRAMHELLIRIQQINLQNMIGKMENPNAAQFQLYMSYFEIYNEQVHDLLEGGSSGAGSSRTTTGGMTNNYRVVDTANTTAFRGLSSHLVPTVETGLTYISKAIKARRSGTNQINSDSSRSHAVCQLRIIKSSCRMNKSNENARGLLCSSSTLPVEDHQHQLQQSCWADLWIVDLAGSERSKRTNGIRRHEAAVINKSLMTLNRCLTLLRVSSATSGSRNNGLSRGHIHGTVTTDVAMRKNGSTSNTSGTSLVGTTTTNPVLPWRESKLTQLFAAHWMGPNSGRTTMIVNVNPAPSDFDETQHVLMYATSARDIRWSTIATNSISDGSNTTSSNNRVGNMVGSTEAEGGAYNSNRQQQRYKMIVKNETIGRKPNIAEQVVNAIRKLSPKRVLEARKRAAPGRVVDSNSSWIDNPIRKKSRSGKTSSIDTATVAAMNTAASVNPVHKPLNSTVAGTGQVSIAKNHEKEIRTLQMELAVVRAENSVLQAKCNDLEEQVESIEQDVRCEVADEMELQMQMMREQYETTIECLKAQLQDPSDRMAMEDRILQSTRKMQMDKADRKINELMNQIAECEDEMTRMRTEHEADMIQLTAANIFQQEYRGEEVAGWDAPPIQEDDTVLSTQLNDAEQGDDILSNMAEEEDNYIPSNDDVDVSEEDCVDGQIDSNRTEEGIDEEPNMFDDMDKAKSPFLTHKSIHEEDYVDAHMDTNRAGEGTCKKCNQLDDMDKADSLFLPHNNVDRSFHEEEYVDHHIDTSLLEERVGEKPIQLDDIDIAYSRVVFHNDRSIHEQGYVDDHIDTDEKPNKVDDMRRADSIEHSYHLMAKQQDQAADDECATVRLNDEALPLSSNQVVQVKSPLPPSGHRAPLSSLSNSKVLNSASEKNWLEPKKGLKKDPATGTFLRPRGRKPKDALDWDEYRGAWRLSVVGDDEGSKA